MAIRCIPSTPPGCLPPATFPGGGSGVAMLTKNLGAEQAAADPHIVLKKFCEAIGPFVEQLAEAANIQEQTRRDQYSSDLLFTHKTWLHGVAFQNMVNTYDAAEQVRDRALSMCQDLARLDPSLGMNPSPWSAAWMLDRDISSGIVPCDSTYTEPSLNLNALFVLLSATIKIIDGYKLEDEPYRRGRPTGIRRFPGLDNLVFLLQLSSLSANASFTAYTEGNIAKGSLINALDMLWHYLASKSDWKYLTAFLPNPDQHRALISSYQRILKDARQVFYPSGPLRLQAAVRRLVPIFKLFEPHDF
jgi:hypothetical protein